MRVEKNKRKEVRSVTDLGVLHRVSSASITVSSPTGNKSGIKSRQHYLYIPSLPRKIECSAKEQKALRTFMCT
jgi:hypothetical protein